MAELVRVDVDAVLQHVARVCVRHPEVLGACVFGSALGRMRPDSDIDVGIALRPTAAAALDPWGCEGPLEADLGWFGRHPFHVTVLSEAGAIFAVRALHEGRTAYVADQGGFTDFLERVALGNRMTAWRYWNAVTEVNGWDPRRTRSASPNARGT